MTLTTILLIILVILLVGALPSWRYSRRWGYVPSGFLAALIVVVVVVMVNARL
jgi:hypothetical protein